VCPAEQICCPGGGFFGLLEVLFCVHRLGSPVVWSESCWSDTAHVRPVNWLKARSMDALTPASADDLPPLGELIVDDPFWAYPAGAARHGVAHLRVWATAGLEPRYLAVVTETGGVASVTGSAGRIWAVLAGRFGPSLVLLEHDLAPESGEASRPWTWSRPARMAARTGPGCGRRRRRTPGTPGWSGGWLLTGTRSSAGRPASSTGVRTRAVCYSVALGRSR
jgi:hypothetical protein